MLYQDGFVYYNEIDFDVNEHDFYTCLMYLGKPFTGTLVEGKMTTEFKNGNADGEAFEYHKNGNLIYYAVFKDGYEVLWKIWYPNGQPREDSELGRLWDTNGVLVKDNSHWLHRSNQSPKARRDSVTNEMIYLAPNGAIAAKLITTNSKPSCIYYDDVLFEWYYEILKNPCPELSPEFDKTNSYTRFIWGWIWKIHQRDAKKGIEILQHIATHENKEIAKEAEEMLNNLNRKTDKQYMRSRWL
ncbi:toxin-antitoxin system YwqK family antitoxin [Kordia jejudonensis]|uniref:toxin-antitoxin system YwqK family antitoxin n=1 Tax=Kordia jejudonensis TaxID=1348245 RepID=UPI00069C9E2F|nr:hypothetical protein [Kordia jejudonensis]